MNWKLFNVDRNLWWAKDDGQGNLSQFRVCSFFQLELGTQRFSSQTPDGQPFHTHPGNKMSAKDFKKTLSPKSKVLFDLSVAEEELRSLSSQEDRILKTLEYCKQNNRPTESTYKRYLSIQKKTQPLFAKLDKLRSKLEEFKDKKTESISESPKPEAVVNVKSLVQESSSGEDLLEKLEASIKGNPNPDKETCELILLLRSKLRVDDDIVKLTAERGNLQRQLDSWWESLSLEAQQDYLKKHPGSDKIITAS